MSHITGGGFPDNVPRVLPEGLDVVIHPDAWSWPPLFRFLMDKGRIPPAEMLRVFNCGIGMVLIVPASKGLDVKRRLDAAGEDWKQIGRVQQGSRQVRFV
jgi:phosphoribosylaminoimidazole (AIR) synthetase